MAGDSLELSLEVAGQTQISLQQLSVASDGQLTAPLIGDVPLAGLTLAEARAQLEQAYRPLYVGSLVVMLRREKDDEALGQWGHVTVLGRVKKPGRVPLDTAAGMNLSDALFAAGGFGPSAKQNEIIVSRVDADGQKFQYTCDFSRLGRTGSIEDDLLLLGGDVVFVPERLF